MSFDTLQYAELHLRHILNESHGKLAELGIVPHPMMSVDQLLTEINSAEGSTFETLKQITTEPTAMVLMRRIKECQ